MAEITMRRLLQAGAHFGHQTRYWAPTMAPYIFGDRNKIHIINLEKTLPMLRQAMNYLGSVAAQGGKVLFVGTKRQAGQAVREHAIRSGSAYVDHRWLGGMLTNYKTVKNSITRLKELEQMFASGATARLSKKEALNLERERIKLDRTLSGIKDMNGLPDVLFVIDVEQEYIAVAEANKLGIPVVAVVDTNCSPAGIDYIIPGNDDSARAIVLYLEAAVDSITEARTSSGPAAVVGGDDEYIEVDETTGEVIAPSLLEEGARKVVKRKSAVVKVSKARKAATPAVDAEATESADGKADEGKADKSTADEVKTADAKVAEGKAEEVKTPAKPRKRKTAGSETLKVKARKTPPKAAEDASTPTPSADATATDATTETPPKVAAAKKATKKVTRKKVVKKKVVGKA